MAYHFHGRDGASFTDATLHADPDCSELDAPVRPLAESSAPEDGEYCGECADAGTDTCQTVKSDGEVCGRERPCPYHD